MSSIVTVRRNFLAEFKKHREQLQGCSSAQLFVNPRIMPGEAHHFTVFLRTTPELSHKMLASDYDYPVELLMNTKTILACLRKPLRQGHLKVDWCEVMTAALADVPNNDWGATINEDNRLVVPRSNVMLYDKSKVKKDPSATWAHALLARDWPALKPNIFSWRVPSLYVIHVPDKPLEDITDAEWRNVAIMCIGWNYLISVGPSTTLLENYIKDFVAELTAAMPLD